MQGMLRFHLGSLVNWAGREAQAEMMVSTIQEGIDQLQMPSWKIEIRPGGPGCPWGTAKTNLNPAAAYNIKKWMQSLEKDASESEVRNDKTTNCGTEWRNAHSQPMGRSRRWCRRQGAPWLLRVTSCGSPSSGGGSSDWGSKWSSHQSAMTRGSRESNWAARTGRGLRVKVNLPIIKDEKTKYNVTYHSWQWDIAIFCHSGWVTNTCCHMFSGSLQGFPADLAGI